MFLLVNNDLLALISSLPLHILEEIPYFLVEKPSSSIKAMLAWAAHIYFKTTVIIITPSLSEEMKVIEDLAFFTSKSIIELPSWDCFPEEKQNLNYDLHGTRLNNYFKIKENPHDTIVVTDIKSCFQYIPQLEDIELGTCHLKKGYETSFEKLQKTLIKMGYTCVSVVQDKGQFALRGGLFDIFTPLHDKPVRIEFLGEEIESIRFFDIASQKSTHICESVDIPFADEFYLLKQCEKITLFDLVPQNSILVFDEMLQLEEELVEIQSMVKKQGLYFSSFESIQEKIAEKKSIFFSEVGTDQFIQNAIQKYPKESGESVRIYWSSGEFKAFQWHHPFQSVSDFLTAYDDENHTSLVDSIHYCLKLPELEAMHWMFIAQNKAESHHLHQLIDQLDLLGNVTITYGYLSEGFVAVSQKLIVIPLVELTHNYKIRRQKLRSYQHVETYDALDIVPGDYVVHLSNGIGKFTGIEKKNDVHGNVQEYLVIEYAEKGKLFVPLTQSNMISKYIGASEIAPKLHTMGSKLWQKTKSKAELAILGYAKDILKAQAERELKGGYAFKEDGEELQEFEASFPYTETPDQKKAIEEVKKDMCSSKSMDRLLVGDVGYGKTEVALRAAFKCVLDGHKQVAVLVPTTVLATQHWDTFSARMAGYPIKIGVISRFQSVQKNKKTIDDTAAGKIDILIGTHRLLSRDVHFADLGLIIVDEEQRFGVKAKEHLKKLKVGVDCLTLSATPIPRTLYMAIAGVKQLSVINTPPFDRVPMKTFVEEAEDSIIQKALLHEYHRKGQSFIIYNHIDSILEHASKIQKLIPPAKIGITHGKMKAEEIDFVFHQFVHGKIDILVTTTIVENGIDIPNANTILIYDSHQFGMATLYQLRGRVGRWMRRAYAYLLIPRGRFLPEIAMKRIYALKDNAGWGGGMKIALKDLELRGAGDLIGVEQSGHVASIGFHLYCKLLKQTMKALSGQKALQWIDTRLEFPFSARIPEDYIHDSDLRFQIYQKLSDAETRHEMEEVMAEVQDRFGRPPAPVLYLQETMYIRLFCSQHQISKLTWDANILKIEQSSTKQIKTVPTTLPRSPQGLADYLIGVIQTAFNRDHHLLPSENVR